MKRPIWSAVLTTLLFVALVRRASVRTAERASAAGCSIRELAGRLDRVRFVSSKLNFTGASTFLITLLARLLVKHRAGRLSASRLLARARLSTPRIARRTRVAQDAVRMLRPGNITWPRRQPAGNFFRPAQLAARGGRCAGAVSE